jgi:hypothetical protein
LDEELPADEGHEASLAAESRCAPPQGLAVSHGEMRVFAGIVSVGVPRVWVCPRFTAAG